MIIEEMYHHYNLLNFMKIELTNKGYNFKSLAWINGQLDLLNNLIKQESFNVLNVLLRKTNYRLLKTIDKGQENLIDIYNNPYEWQLGALENNPNEWFSSKSLIFSTERQKLVFSKNIDGYKYINSKWQ